MANNIPTPPPEDNLAGPDRMLDAIAKIKGGHGNLGALRTMFVGPAGGKDAADKAMPSTKPRVQQRKPNPSALSPSI